MPMPSQPEGRPHAPGPIASDQPDIIRLAAWLVATALVLAGLYLGQEILVPLAVAFLISFALSPIVTWITRKGLPRVLSVTLVLAAVCLVIMALGVLMGGQVRSLGAELPTYQSTIREKIDDLAQSMKGPGIFEGAFKTVIGVQDQVEKAVTSESDVHLQRVEIVPAPDSPFKTAVAWLGPIMAPIATVGIVLVFVFLALLDSGDLRDRLIRMLGGNLHRTTDAIEEAGRRISKYLVMQVIVNVTYAIPMALGLWLIGVPGWILWGVLAALMRFIPYVGPLISAVFPIGLAFAVDPGWNMVLMTVGLILLLELISNNIVEPMLYGTSTGLSAISLIAAAIFWTALWGPAGLVLSTPLTVCLLVVGRNLPQLKFLETLLGSSPVLDLPTRIYQRLIADDPAEAIEIASDAIDATSVSEFYDAHGIEVLQLASQDFLTSARAGHRLRVVNGMDEMLDDLREEYPAPITLSGRPRVVCIGGKWEIDTVACEMLAHALAFDGHLAEQRSTAALTRRYVDKLDLEGVEVVCLSYFSREPERLARTFAKRLRTRWPEVKVVLVLWSLEPSALDALDPEALGVDAVTNSLIETTRRIEFMLAPEEARARQIAPRHENDEARVEALMATHVLDGHVRDDLDALATRAAEVFNVEFAVISAIGAETEYIIGQSRDLPGERTTDGTDMIMLARDDAICDHVVFQDDTLVIDDTRRDPRFAEHPAILQWNTRFYAGAPVRTADGLILGALCLLDTSARELAEGELELLNEMAGDAAALITGEAAPEPPESRTSEAVSTSVGQRLPD